MRDWIYKSLVGSLLLLKRLDIRLNARSPKFEVAIITDSATKRTEQRPAAAPRTRRRAEAPGPPGPLHCAMISSKAWRCSRSRRRSSAAMCRFQGGKPAARSPDAISAERRGRQHRGDAGGCVRPAAGRELSHHRGSRGRRPTPAMAPRPSSVRGPRSAAARRNGDSGCPRRRLAPPPSRQPSPPRCSAAAAR